MPTQRSISGFSPELENHQGCFAAGDRSIVVRTDPRRSIFESDVGVDPKLPDVLTSIQVFHGKNFPGKTPLDRIQGLTLVEVSRPRDLRGSGVAILFLDHGLIGEGGPLPLWRQGFQGNLSLIVEEGIEGGDLLVPKGWPESFTLNALDAALRELQLLVDHGALEDVLASEHAKIFQLTAIGVALSAETNLNNLLRKILTEGRSLACCDAASLFLINRQDETSPRLEFKLTQNDSISFPFEEQSFPLNKQSISGFVAVTGKTLNIPDLYQLPPEATYHFNSSFDERMGYRTCSMLTIPMKNHAQEVIGILQFINRKTAPNIRLATPEITRKYTLPFTDDLVNLLEALASQAAVAIEKTILITRINHLFEGFVSAAVIAIEQRDPTTSGHSFRVAELTTYLARALHRSGDPIYGGINFSDTQIREIRYASLLHDFGKVGVREPVLIKGLKLSSGGMDLIWHRFNLFKERLHRRSLQERLDFVLRHGRKAYHSLAGDFDHRLKAELDRLSRYFDAIEKANKPSLMEEGHFSHLQQIRDVEPIVVDHRKLALLKEDEFLALSVRKGTLTEDERREIESHVVHTFNFLKQIPWTPELSQVPHFAVAHHEKLDGSGYPDGLREPEIPLPSKLMTIADIFDALTASDRPYKKAVPPERALAILEAETDKGHLDANLVKVFIESETYKHAHYEGPSEIPRDIIPGSLFMRNVCDYDLIDSDKFSA